MKVVTGVTAWSAQENPLQALTVADDIAARGRAVRTDVDCVLRCGRREVAEGIPIAGMSRKFVAVQVAQRAGWPGPADAVEVRPMAIGIGTGDGEGIVRFDKTPVQAVGVRSPLIGVHGELVAEVALGAGNLRNPPAKIGAVAGGAGFHMGLGLPHVPGRQPGAGVLPADGVKIGLRIFIPAPGEHKEGKQQYYRQSDRRQRSSIYL
jgi:hypothetical protein